ncbi:MAG: F0F1 ATP synthase subunit A [Acidobacteria bacterium]|nr:F0F1 ATP synthase subunit A [Acidobacteriota bacterium]
MTEHELWLTRLFNDYLAGVANTILGLFNLQAHNPARPWENWLTTELLVVLLIMVMVAVIRGGLSVDKPGRMQHLVEVVWGFLGDTAEDTGIHHPAKYLPYFGTLFIFILTCNLIGIIPAFESPTMFPWVPCGCAIATFLYYNFWGFREQGIGTYLKHFAGPMPALAPLMVPIELVSHMARPLSLTIRLFANMFAGEQVTIAFLKLTFLIAPAVFMGLHVFVSFLQAYIFALLTMIYVSGAVAHEH